MEIILYCINIILVLNIYSIQSEGWYRGNNEYNLSLLTQIFIALDITLLVYFQHYYFLAFLFILFLSLDIYVQKKRKRLYYKIAKIIDPDNSQKISIEDIFFNYNPKEFNIYYKVKTHNSYSVHFKKYINYLPNQYSEKDIIKNLMMNYDTALIVLNELDKKS